MNNTVKTKPATKNLQTSIKITSEMHKDMTSTIIVIIKLTSKEIMILREEIVVEAGKGRSKKSNKCTMIKKKSNFWEKMMINISRLYLTVKSAKISSENLDLNSWKTKKSPN